MKFKITVVTVTFNARLTLEQTILRELQKVNNWSYSSLVKQRVFVLDEVWEKEEQNQGLITADEANLYYRHLSNDKRRLDPNDEKVLLIQSEIITLIKQHIPELLPKLFQVVKSC